MKPSANPDDVFDLIEADITAIKRHAESLKPAWADLAREIAYATAARDCASGLKSVRELALNEIRPRLEDWAPMEAPWGEEVDLSKVDQQELKQHIDEMFGETK